MWQLRTHIEQCGNTYQAYTSRESNVCQCGSVAVLLELHPLDSYLCDLCLGRKDVFSFILSSVIFEVIWNPSVLQNRITSNRVKRMSETYHLQGPFWTTSLSLSLYHSCLKQNYLLIISLSLSERQTMEKWKKVSAGVLGALIVLSIIITPIVIALNSRWINFLYFLTIIQPPSMTHSSPQCE